MSLLYKSKGMRSKETTLKTLAEFTPQQERIHANLHILGIFFGVFGVPLLIFSALSKDAYSLLGISIYGVCYLMVFIFSSLYHSSTDKKIKRLYLKLDRISIYFLIAGTYTPLIKFYVFNDDGINMLKILWCLVILGIYFEIQFPDRFRAISVVFYLFMGLIFLFLPVDLIGSMPPCIGTLVITGIVLYAIGVFFYLWHRWKYHHALWHIFVLSASIFHYMAVLRTLEILK